MSLYDLILSRRSIRQFKPETISQDALKDIANAGRLAPSAANRQPLEFVLVEEEKLRSEIFSCLKWAGYIAPEGNPKPGNEPRAYIVVLVNSKIREKGFEWDVGAAVENMILAAWDRGIGSCWIISVERDRVQDLLRVPERYWIDSVLALGHPAETPVIEDAEDSIEYWKDEEDRLHVPKRKLLDIIHFNKF
jgi:nitroreductase